jgi:cyclophilin family peptidyl-prolyl cis-trans isomerase
MRAFVVVLGLLAWAAPLAPIGAQSAAQRGGSAQAPARGATGQRGAAPAAAARPTITFETVKGTFVVELYPADAPKSVAHVLTLAKRNFYRGLRIHRLVPGFVVQFGDPQTRDMTRRQAWGNGGSGRSVGVAEIKRPHRLGSVALAHTGDPTTADSQMYIALAGPDSPQIRNIEGDFTVIGQVVSGMDVVRKLQETDLIRQVTVKEPAPASK